MSKIFISRSVYRLFFIFSLMLMLLAVGVPTAHALDINWVSQSDVDVSFRVALSNAGHNVSWADSRYETLTADKITELNAADLVVVARNTDSTNLSGPTEPAQWSGITTRLMLCSGYLAQNGRWQWLKGGVLNTGADQLIVDPADPAYTDLGVISGQTTDAYSVDISATIATDAGNGTLLAKAAGVTAYVMMARWAAGSEFYSGSGYTSGAERVFFPIDNADYSDFTAFGESVFHNLIKGDKEWIAKINFQPAGAPIPAGYLVDSGAAFGSRGNGLVYGWDEDITDRARDRGFHFDQRFDTMIHAFEADNTLRTWEISLPDGVYYVDLLCGDSQFNSVTNNYDIEGVTLTDPTPGTSNFDNYQSVEVTVTDGRLTLSLSGFANQKVISIKIVAASDYTVNPEDYARSATITFDGYTGSTPLTNFPVLIRLNPSTPVSGWYGLADANGYDVQFSDSDGNLLSHEFELWNPGGESIVWVKVPLIDDSTDYITMLWGRVGQTELNFWPLNVWSDGYAAVWHFDETSGMHYDSTGAGFDSSTVSSVTQNVSGQIDGADYFKGVLNSYVEVPYSATLESVVNRDCTISIWAKSDVAASAAPNDIAYMCDFGLSHGNGVGLLFNRSHAKFANGTIAAYYNGAAVGAGTVGAADTWYHVTLTHAGTNLVLYINGAADAVTNAPLMDLGLAPLRFGAEAKFGATRNWKGVLDEPRISSTARSGDWVKNEYDSQIHASTYCRMDVVPMGTVILLQ